MLTVTAVQLAVSFKFRNMTNQQRPVLTGPDWSFNTKIILNYSPIYELFNDSKNIIFGTELKQL